MKQIFENMKDGKIELLEVPIPAVGHGKLLVKNFYSLISSGTEKGMLEFAGKNLLEKARERPDLVNQVLEKVKSEGVLTAYQKAMNRLEDLSPMGYSSSGQVVEVGKGAQSFSAGDFVACAGAGYANHAEYVVVPENLVIKLPSNVSLEEASFVALGGIALQGIRQSEATFGESVAVIGLGLVGLLTVELLKAFGCKVIGMDVDSNKKELATELGVDLFIDLSKDDAVIETLNFTNGYGADSVLMTASTNLNTPIELAPQILRDRGTLVVVGVSKIDIPRNPYYKKEISVKFSRSYGPGRYDPVYEERGIDYPVGYVRWTEKRNMEIFLSLISEGKLNLKPLISHKFKIEDYQKAYDLISGRTKSNLKPIAILFEYDKNIEKKQVVYLKQSYQKVTGKVGVSIIGAGNFTKSTLLTNISKLKESVDLVGIASSSGGSAGVLAKKYNFAYSTSDDQTILTDNGTDLVFITVPHNLHAQMAIEALENGKDVFVEKPLAINLEQLKKVTEAKKESGKRIMVGFNRRFAPLTRWIKQSIGNITPSIVTYRVNAGNVPLTSWINDPDVGGGRIIGEICHFVDFMIYLFNSYPSVVYGDSAKIQSKEFLSVDNCIFTIKFENGAVGNIIYDSVAPETLSKERIEILGVGFAGVIDNFVRGEIHKGGKVVSKRLISQDKGFLEEYEEVIKAIKDGKDFPIPFEDIAYTTLTTFALKESLEQKQPIKIDGNF